MPATRGQLEHIRTLIHKCVSRFIEVPFETYKDLREENISKEKAQRIIENLEYKLGGVK